MPGRGVGIIHTWTRGQTTQHQTRNRFTTETAARARPRPLFRRESTMTLKTWSSYQILKLVLVPNPQSPHRLEATYPLWECQSNIIVKVGPRFIFASFSCLAHRVCDNAGYSNFGRFRVKAIISQSYRLIGRVLFRGLHGDQHRDSLRFDKGYYCATPRKSRMEAFQNKA